MLRLLKKLRRNERGNVLILTAAAMPLLLGSAGLAVDTIQWTLWKRQLQRAADSAAIAGVYQRVQLNTRDAVVEAVEHDLGLNQATGIALMAGFPTVELEANNGQERLPVEVELRVQKSLAFSSIFLASPPQIVARARAASVPGSGEYCFVSLEDSATKTGITVAGNANIELDCGMMSNSPAPNSALGIGSSSTVKATNIDAVGDIAESDRWNVDDYNPYTPALPDPFGNVNISRPDMRCFSDGSNYPLLGNSTSGNLNGNNATITLADARARIGHTTANCFRGLSVGANQTLTLPPGTYYIGEAGMNVQGNLTCVGCTFVLTRINESNAVGRLSVNANPNNGGNLNITAPTTGNFANIAIFQDRNAVDSPSNTNRINGSSSSVINGAVYFPKQELVYNGNGTSSFVCTRLVGRRLYFSGNSSISNKFARNSNCPGRPSGGFEAARRVRLVS
jgi:hypothetical protein